MNHPFPCPLERERGACCREMGLLWVENSSLRCGQSHAGDREENSDAGKEKVLILGREWGQAEAVLLLYMSLWASLGDLPPVDQMCTRWGPEQFTDHS